MKSLFAIAALTIILFSSCSYISGKRIRGNGVIKTETHEAGSSFTDIDVSGAIDVYVRQDSVATIKVEADENLMDYIEISSNGNTLNIGPRNRTSLKPTRQIKVYVSNPSYKNFEASGACNIYTDAKISNADGINIDLTGASEVKMELAAPKVDVDLTGASKVSLKGETKVLHIGGTGASTINCPDLMAENVTIKLSGAGEALVFASVSLDVSVSGAGDVKYRGNATVNKSIRGAGSVKKID